MTHDMGLAQRIRELFDEKGEIEEKAMFGGVAWMVNGNLAFGVHQDSLIVRVGSEKYGEALRKPHTSVFDITGRAMTGWIMVDSKGCATDDQLEDWARQGLEFALTLPVK